MEMSVDEKMGIITDEFGIPADDKIREDVGEMCNLSQGIKEKGRAEGETGVILKMYKKGYTLEQIADVAEKSIEEIKSIIEKREPVLT